MKKIAVAVLAASLVVLPVAQAKPKAATQTDAPAGTYKLDKAHASLTFRVNHIGFSNYTAHFSDFDATLQLDPKHPEKSSVVAKVKVPSLTLPTPPKGFLDELLGKQWLDAALTPEMTFTSTRVKLKGRDVATITGDLTLHGVTHPVTLEAKFNGGYAGNEYEPNARIGFSAHGKLNRSDFGVSYGIPAPGSTMGVSDNVDIIIEAEFMGPPLAKPAKP
jgi:polyisoprenoid-binding protein YceI